MNKIEILVVIWELNGTEFFQENLKNIYILRNQKNSKLLTTGIKIAKKIFY